MLLARAIQKKSLRCSQNVNHSFDISMNIFRLDTYESKKNLNVFP
jgi:hypothetical protein